jgi:NitT/TauT family transport system substrate-binding protein
MKRFSAISMRSLLTCWILAWSVTGGVWAGEKVRVGVLAFGTVNWELDAIQQQGLASRRGIELEVVPLASGDASNVALQGGAVDVVVTDWLWVARQRAAGRDYTLYPYSNAVGSLMVDPQRGPSTIEGLTGKRIGIAGGPNDKSWLLMRAYTQKTLGKDLGDLVEAQFAAPPLLNQLMLQGDLDGTLNFWHFAAKLSAAGMRPLITTQQALQGLGV